MTIADELRHCAAHNPDPFNPFWVDTAKRLMKQAADALDAANEAVAAEYSRATASQPTDANAFCEPFHEQSEDERTLRYLLAVRSGEPGELYGDDGELQLGGFPHPIDFRRDSVSEIRRKLDARDMDRFARQLRAADKSGEAGK